MLFNNYKYSQLFQFPSGFTLSLFIRKQIKAELKFLKKIPQSF